MLLHLTPKQKQQIRMQRDLIVNINRMNTNQANISITINFPTTAHGYLNDTTIDIMQYMLTYHDISIISSANIAESASMYVYTTISPLANYEGTNVHIILYLTEFIPQAIHGIDVDIALKNLHAERRIPSPAEEDEFCPICIEQIVKGEVINSLQCRHIYHPIHN